MDKKMSKREKFKKSIVIAGAASIMATAGVAKANSEEYNLSKYDVDNNKYIDYIDDSENEKLQKMQELDDKINEYEELSNKQVLSKEEKEKFNSINDYLKEEMSSGDLADFYLKDILKEKIKEAYQNDKTSIYKVETHWNADNEISIKMTDKYGRSNFMEDKDKVTPIKSAMNDIATLQGYEGKDKFSKSDINKFIKIQKNMKGFSNIKFIKTEGEPLKYAQIDLSIEDDLEH